MLWKAQRVFAIVFKVSGFGLIAGVQQETPVQRLIEVCFVMFMAKPTVFVEFVSWRTRLLFIRECSIFLNESNLFLFDVQIIGPLVEVAVRGYIQRKAMLEQIFFFSHNGGLIYLLRMPLNVIEAMSLILFYSLNTYIPYVHYLILIVLIHKLHKLFEHNSYHQVPRIPYRFN